MLMISGYGALIWLVVVTYRKQRIRIISARRSREEVARSEI
jgi:uncharacterized DUF497 family protein